MRSLQEKHPLIYLITSVSRLNPFETEILMNSSSAASVHEQTNVSIQPNPQSIIPRAMQMKVIQARIAAGSTAAAETQTANMQIDDGIRDSRHSADARAEKVSSCDILLTATYNELLCLPPT